MKVVITGGAGFIGYHTARLLLAHGHTVVVLDDMSKAPMLDRLRSLGLEPVRVDVRVLEELKEAFRGADAVLHLAALINVEESARVPELYHEVNATGTLNVLKASVDAGVPKVVYASSAAVYGNPEKLPISEDHPTNPVSVYGATKLAGELYCRAFHEVFGLSVLILRYFNVYGPGQSEEYAGVITRFSERLSRGEPPIIYGDGNQTRDFVHVRDVAAANELALEANVKFGVYNIASGREVSILELAELMSRIAGVNVQPVFAPPRPGDVRRSVADVSRAREELGFEPSVTLEEGLSDLLLPGEGGSIL